MRFLKNLLIISLIGFTFSSCLFKDNFRKNADAYRVDAKRR
jgi:hypothetical protein